ncbi:MAG TPA: galactokinase [Trebonia sp.]|nr:galactokinase [Trebonia sp.]
MPAHLDALAEATARGFTDAYGRDCAGVWSAPGRVNLIGEHTDYNEGFVLPFAIGSRTSVAAAGRDDGVLALASAQFPGKIRTLRLATIRPGAVSGWPAYPAGVAWALGLAGRSAPAAGTGGASLYINSAVPTGSGLSSSAALECAVALALRDLYGLDATRRDLALACQRAENDVVGAPTGIMDEFASLFGEHGAAVFIDCRAVQGENVPLPLDQAGLEIVLADTREQHAHAAGGYADRRASCDRAARVLGVRALRDVGPDDLDKASRVLDAETFRRVRHVVTEDERVLDAVAALRAGALESDPAAVGALLTASHASMRDDFEITTPALDLAAATAVEAGAVGARMTGGGFGGAVIALVARARAAETADAIAAAFARAGLTAPRLDRVAPSDGARRDR